MLCIAASWKILTIFWILCFLQYICPQQHQRITWCCIEESPFEGAQAHDVLHIFILETNLKVDTFSQVNDPPWGFLSFCRLPWLVALKCSVGPEDKVSLVPFLWNIVTVITTSRIFTKKKFLMGGREGLTHASNKTVGQPPQYGHSEQEHIQSFWLAFLMCSLSEVALTTSLSPSSVYHPISKETPANSKHLDYL